MDDLIKKLTITNSNGEVITLFDGKITLGQLIAVIVALITLIVVFRALRGATRLLLSFAVIMLVALYFNLVSPTQIANVTDKMQEIGSGVLQQFANTSDKIRISDKDVQLNLGGTWVSLSDIDNFVISDSGVVTINFNGETLSSDDSDIVGLLKLFK